MNSSSGQVSFSCNDTYGLTSNTDSHMMKNSEWGAISYLSHSIYGINEEVRINNNSNYITGCGATSSNAAEVTECQNEYSKVSNGIYPQSVTGNITGIFDMSGGSFEYVMAYLTNASTNNSGFSTYPVEKYHDRYSNSIFVGDNVTNMDFCNLLNCGGHALYETLNWYNDFPYFVNSSRPWFVRGGGYYGAGSSAGIFVSGYNAGGRVTSYSCRTVLIVTESV